MSKQNSIFSNILLKIIALILVSIALVFAYSEISQYNQKFTLVISDYYVESYVGVIVFGILLILAIFLGINGIFYNIYNIFDNFRENYKGSKIKKSVSALIESSILLGIGSKSEAYYHLDYVDNNYLDDQQKKYVEIIKSLASSETVPVTFYSYITKFPFLKNLVSKKLASIELKLGNLEKALEFARQYYYAKEFDEEINIILAKIYFETSDYKALDGIISSTSEHQISETCKIILSNLYVGAAKKLISESRSSEVMEFCRKALELNPGSVVAAELFSEIAIASQKINLVEDVVLKAFCLEPNFGTFLVLNRYKKHNNEEFYNLLIESADYKAYPELFIAIASILDLSDKQKDLIAELI